MKHSCRDIKIFHTCQARHAARSWIISERVKRLKWLCGTKTQSRAPQLVKKSPRHSPARRRRSISCIRFSTSAQRRRALQRSAAELMHSKGELEGSRRRRVAITVRLRCCYASGAALQRAGDRTRTRAPLCLIDWLRPHATTKTRAGCVGSPEIWVLRRRRSAAAGKEERRSCLRNPQGFAFAARSVLDKMEVGRNCCVQGTPPGGRVVLKNGDEILGWLTHRCSCNPPLICALNLFDRSTANVNLSMDNLTCFVQIWTDFEL